MNFYNKTKLLQFPLIEKLNRLRNAVFIAALIILVGFLSTSCSNSSNSLPKNQSLTNGVRVGEAYYFVDGENSVSRIDYNDGKAQEPKTVFSGTGVDKIIGLCASGETVYFFSEAKSLKDGYDSLALYSMDPSSEEATRINETKNDLTFNRDNESWETITYGNFVLFNEAFYTTYKGLDDYVSSRIIKIDLNGNITNYFSEDRTVDINSLAVNENSLFCVADDTETNSGIEILNVTDPNAPEVVFSKIADSSDYIHLLYCDEENLLFTTKVIDKSDQGEVMKVQLSDKSAEGVYSFDNLRANILSATSESIYTCPNYYYVNESAKAPSSGETATPEIEITQVDWKSGEEKTLLKATFTPSEFSDMPKASIGNVNFLKQYGDQIYYDLSIYTFSASNESGPTVYAYYQVNADGQENTLLTTTKLQPSDDVSYHYLSQ